MSLFPEWEAEYDAKHAGEVALPDRLKAMHREYGVKPDATCKTCKKLVRSDAGTAGHYLKCLLYGVTRGAGTDWRAKGPACGKHEEGRK